MRKNHVFFMLLLLGVMMLRGAATLSAAESQKYSFMVFSNPVQGKTADYLAWYRGQHIHDLLHIDGFVAAQFYKLSEIQPNGQPQKYRYLMIWEIETGNLNDVFDRMRKRMEDGTIVMSPAFDNAPGASVFQPISRRLTAQDVKGKAPAEVLKMALLSP